MRVSAIMLIRAKRLRQDHLGYNDYGSQILGYTHIDLLYSCILYKSNDFVEY